MAMTDCEWDDPHDGYARFCLTHECWITAPVTVTACPISDLLGKVQRVREEVGTWPVALDKTVAACADSVLRALDGGAE